MMNSSRASVDPHLSVDLRQLQRIHSWQKRSVDIILGIIIAALILPLCVVVAVLALLFQGWPILHIQDRVGCGGKLLRLPKFRTMRVDAHATPEDFLGVVIERTPEQYRGDARISAFGRFLRRFSLDELPQIYCVLVGSMSLVGPRPILFSEVPYVEPHHDQRHLIKPGLTGLWQISGRKEVAWSDRMDLDLDYINNWSLGGDLRILMRTFTSVIVGHGAY